MNDDEIIEWLRRRISDVNPDPPVAFSPQRWRDQLEAHLHTTVDELADQSTVGLRGWPTITRQTVRAYTSAPLEAPDSVERAFVAAMIWGGGPPAPDGDTRHPWRTATALATPGAITCLAQAAQAVHEEQLGEALRLATRPRYLGTSFATKWLWAVNSPDQHVAALIMDAQVAGILEELGRPELTVSASDPRRKDRGRYVTYCVSATRWATELDVPPDVIERTLFSAAANR